MAKKFNSVNYQSEDQNDVARFVRILIGVVVIVGLAYLFTRLVITKDLFDKKDNETTFTEGSINYNTTLIGSMFTKPEEEYYVLIYDSEKIESLYYSGILNSYSLTTDHLKVYVADLNNGLNAKYYTEDEINVNTNDLEKFKVGDYALIKISNGKITNTYTTEEAITNILVPKKDTN